MLGDLLGDQSVLTGASIQSHYSECHATVLKWVEASGKTERPWVAGHDEQGNPGTGVPPDPGFEGFSGQARSKDSVYDLHDVRKFVLWGTLMAGGVGVEYYFGHRLPQNDIVCEDWRSREKAWEYGRIALAFFRGQLSPFWEMSNRDALAGNTLHDNSRYCFAKEGELYLVYLPSGGEAALSLDAVRSEFSVEWFNPRMGGALEAGSVHSVSGGGEVSLGMPPTDWNEDWCAVVRRE